MMTGQILLYVLLLAQVPPEEIEARKIWFKATIVNSALAPCTSFLPGHATEFERASARWLEENAQSIREGEASFRREAGEAFRPEEFDIEGARRQFSELLATYPTERQVEWCRTQLQIESGDPDAG